MPTKQQIVAWCDHLSNKGKTIFLKQDDDVVKCRFKKADYSFQGKAFYVFLSNHPVAGSISRLSHEVDWELTLAESPLQSKTLQSPPSVPPPPVQRTATESPSQAEVPQYVKYIHFLLATGSGNTNLVPQDLRKGVSDPLDYSPEDYSQLTCNPPFDTLCISWAGRGLYLTTDFAQKTNCFPFWNIPSHTGLGICNDVDVNDQVNVKKAADAVAGDWRRMNRMTLEGTGNVFCNVVHTFFWHSRNYSRCI
jgi:hypothetical protein